MVTLHITTIAMAGNIGMELNFVVGKINHVLPNFILPTLIKNSIQTVYENLQNKFVMRKP